MTGSLLKSLKRALGRGGSATPAGRPRILYFIHSYPTFSETYMHEEMRSLWADHEIEIITLHRPGDPREHSFPHHLIEYRDACPIFGPAEAVDLSMGRPAQQEFVRRAGEIIERFKPDVMHGHYLGMGMLLRPLAEKHRVPFTIRTHSQDTLSEPPAKIAAGSATTHSPWCVGVIAFPAMRHLLEKAGADPEKIVICWPVINFARFYKPEPRRTTGRVLCAGPSIPKKAHGQMVDLALALRSRGLSLALYAKGYALPEVVKHNEASGNPLEIAYADPDEMPNVYPRFDWLVYPGDLGINKIGLPCAIAEAQASGIGICWQELPGRCQEQLEFLDGAGFLFRDLSEVPALLEQPYPETMRRRGFAAARRCDIEGHKHILTRLWAGAPARAAAH